jgi:hypothetical protein
VNNQEHGSRVTLYVPRILADRGRRAMSLEALGRRRGRPAAGANAGGSRRHHEGLEVRWPLLEEDEDEHEP